MPAVVCRYQTLINHKLPILIEWEPLGDEMQGTTDQTLPSKYKTLVNNFFPLADSRTSVRMDKKAWKGLLFMLSLKLAWLERATKGGFCSWDHEEREGIGGWFIQLFKYPNE